ncbi:MAG: hypothetical protein ACJ77L_07535, partial [Solirubrobacteraceae bacterium]
MVVANHTFFFADLVGYTAFTAAVGDDRAADMALEVHERVRALLDEHLATSPLPTGGDAARRASVGRPDASCPSPHRGHSYAAAAGGSALHLASTAEQLAESPPTARANGSGKEFHQHPNQEVPR